MSKERIRILAEIAIMSALAMLLDFIIPSTHGLKITVKMLPIIILGLRHGWKAGFAGGFLWGLLQVVLGEAWILNAFQVFIEYFFAFSLLGVAGFFSKPLKAQLKSNNKLKVCLIAGGALVLASIARYSMHFIAGIAFWSDNLPETVNPVINSLAVNGGAFLSETITCLVALLLLAPFFKQILKPDSI